MSRPFPMIMISIMKPFGSYSPFGFMIMAAARPAEHH
jgi:hypothetical protein